MSVAYPSPGVSFPLHRARPPSASTAETLVLVALLLQVIGGVVLFVGVSWFFGWSVLNPYPFAWIAVTGAVALAAVVLLFLYLAYTLSYLKIQQGDYQGAQGPTLVIGVLSLFAGVLPGIFYLIGYVKLGDAMREQQGYAPWYGPGYSTAYAPAYAAIGPAMPNVAPLVCKGCGRLYAVGQFSFCPSCGSKLGP
ncbi:MAG: hypothetical protein L3K09_02825 [Thermoplasmata archaeon]|nr:hypothetical protein [Thermoplasmata archaeon]